MGREIKKALLILIGGGGMGFVLLFLAYLLPTDPIIKNARASVDIFKLEGAYAQNIHGYPSTTLDNYTDAWMMQNALYDGEESALQKCMNVYSYNYVDGEKTGPCERLTAYLEGKAGFVRTSYARYWHGYLIILKPLLLFFDYGDIRGILKFTGLALLLSVCILLEKMGKTQIVPAFAAAMACMEFYTVGMSMQYTWVFIIGLGFSILILKRYQAPERKPVTPLLFLPIGMATSYFDFLTYPVFTLGLPLLFFTVCMREYGSSISLPMVALKSAVYWAFGYGGMWLQKWLLCTACTGENLIADGVESIMIRSGHRVMGEQIGYWQNVYKNLMVLAKYPYVLVCLAAVILLFILGKKENRAGFSPNAFLVYLCIAALPLCWYAVSINHSYIHSFMTYKSLSITVLAVMCAADEGRKLAGAKKAKRAGEQSK